MSINPLNNASALAAQAKAAGKSEPAAGGTSFAESMALSLAGFEAQAVGALSGSALGGSSSSSDGVGSLLSLLKDSVSATGAATGSSSAASALGGLSPTGRNAALYDPESAYGMMSVINQLDVKYKAQYAELSAMGDELGKMQQQGKSLAGLDTSSTDDSVRSTVQGFVDHYNAWVQRFDDDMAPGGLLADTKAAQVSRYELGQEVGNIFNGASAGVHGLADLGVTLDPATGLASIDNTKFAAALADDRSGTLTALQQFGGHVEKAAELLTSDGNFIANRLGNLGRAIDYIDSNHSALEAEFGLGDPAQPTGAVAQALAAYERSRAGQTAAA
jgi:hypothetical protein